MNLLEVKLPDFDPEVDGIIRTEMKRNDETINLIASENYPPKSSMKAISSMLSGIYSEGYPGERYYGGLENIDRLEQLAIARARKVFGAEHANVQALSGSNANLAAYLALLKPGERILSLEIDAGGHLSHGAKVSLVSKIFDVVHYGVDPGTGRLDHEAIRRIAVETRPRLIVCGASAYPRIIDFAAFRAIADEVGALLLADISHIAGLVVAGEHPSPVPHCDVVTTTTHKTLRMTRGALILCRERFAADVDRAVFPVLQGGPHQSNIAAIAVGLKHLETDEYRAYIRGVVVNARTLAGELSAKGFSLVSGGTDNHLMLVDLATLGIDGDAASRLLERASIVVNKNKIPGGKGSAKKPSGIRLGTPAVTTRGMGPDEMRRIAGWLTRILYHPGDDAAVEDARGQVTEMCGAFPIYTMTF
jgi:glycine hydroxymethyltransferase